MSRLIGAALSCLALTSACPAAQGIRLQTQKVGATTYFLVALTPPKDLAMPESPGITRVGVEHLEDFYFPNASEGARRAVVQIPRLVPLDDRTTAVHFAGLLGGKLVFVGKRVGDGPTASCRLLYPVEATGARGLAAVPGDREEKHVKLTLAWADATPVAPPERQQGTKRYPAPDDIQGRHAWAQAMWFARMELRASQAGLFGVSRLLTGRKYEIWSDPLERAEAKARVPAPASGPDLFSVFTGAAHLDEAVMLRRLQEPKDFEASPRTIPVGMLSKVTLAEHDWKKMMGTKTPAAEPLAKSVPHDCYYLTTTSLESFASAWDVLDAWGGSVLRPPQVSDRDHGLRARYERQLCLPTAGLRHFLTKKGFESAALVGSDLYWGEGSDVTVLFEPSDKKHLLATLDALVERTTKPFGGEVQVTHTTYRDVTIDGWRTPRREISAYRAEVGGAVVCSNSPAAIRRVIDAHAGKLASLGDSLDFRYMRTVFQRDAKQEDGFVFLSDAFIRRLVNAPTRVKAMRRQQARAMLALASHAALFAGYETGKLPADTAALLRDSGLEASALTVPDGRPVAWDGKRKQAMSEVYGTLEHGTPLVELSIDKVTASEREAFEAFHGDYMRLWRRFFDPVGIRFGLQPGETKVEVFILPLIESQEYRIFREITTDRRSPEKALLEVPERVPAQTMFQLVLRMGILPKTYGNGVGDWYLAHLGGEVIREDLIRAAIQTEVDPERAAVGALMSPLESMSLGLEVKYPDEFKESLVGGHLMEVWDKLAPGRMQRRHRGVKVSVSHLPGDFFGDGSPAFQKVVPLLKDLPTGVLKPKHLYATKVGDGYYFSLDKENMKRRIDFALGKPKPSEGQGVHAALHLAPPGGKGGRALAAYLDWRTNVKTQASLAEWEGLYACGLVAPNAKPAARDDAVRRLLGYVPVSGDGTALTWRAKEGRMRSDHHGTLAAPTFRGKLPEGAPLANLLRTVRSVQAGLRFREDGLHTTIRIDWSGRD
jgi:hypothetical protein